MAIINDTLVQKETNKWLKKSIEKEKSTRKLRFSTVHTNTVFNRLLFWVCEFVSIHEKTLMLIFVEDPDVN